MSACIVPSLITFTNSPISYFHIRYTRWASRGHARSRLASWQCQRPSLSFSMFFFEGDELRFLESDAPSAGASAAVESGAVACGFFYDDAEGVLQCLYSYE